MAVLPTEMNPDFLLIDLQQLRNHSTIYTARVSVIPFPCFSINNVLNDKEAALQLRAINSGHSLVAKTYFVSLTTFPGYP
jgi:hypothetical protein